MSRNVVSQLLAIGEPLRTASVEFEFEHVSGFRQLAILHPRALNHWYDRDRNKWFADEAIRMVRPIPLPFWMSLSTRRNWPPFTATSYAQQEAVKDCCRDRKSSMPAIPYERFISRCFNAYPKHTARRVEESV